MCVKWTGDYEVAKVDIVAFKFVRRKKGAFGRKYYVSPVQLSHRDPQQHVGTKGKMLEYRRGKFTKGEEPGIYCTADPVKMVNNENTPKEEMAVLVVVIPKGTRFRRGVAGLTDDKGNVYEAKTLNALKVKVIRDRGDTK